MIRVVNFDDRQLLFATRLGKVKKTPLVAYSRPKRTGIKAIKINEDDELIGVTITSGEDEVVLSTASGMSIRFSEQDARPMGRDAAGVNGIALGSEDHVVSMAVVEDGGSLITVCEHGYGKRTFFSEYRAQKRGGKGLIDIRTTKRNGKVVSACALSGSCDAMLMTSGRDVGQNFPGKCSAHRTQHAGCSIDQRQGWRCRYRHGAGRSCRRGTRKRYSARVVVEKSLSNWVVDSTPGSWHIIRDRTIRSDG